MVLEVLKLLGALAFFLYGLTLLSSALQKALGDKVIGFIPKLQEGSLKQILSGFWLTTLVQSSNAATGMIVGFVNAGSLTIDQAFGTILGANIGTTVTVWLIAILTFTIGTEYIGFPLLAIGFVFMLVKGKRNKLISEIIMSTSFVFIGLTFAQSTLNFIGDQGIVAHYLQNWSEMGFASIILFVIVGILTAAVLQSSGATIILTILLLHSGWLPFISAASIVLGANIGTTLTGNLLSHRGNIPAQRAAYIHLLFNTTGVALVLLTIFILNIFVSINDIQSIINCDSNLCLIYGVCAVHSFFNIASAIILIGFCPVFVNIVNNIVKEKPDNSLSRLRYISDKPLSTPAISIAQTFKEIVNFSQVCHEGYSFVKKLINAKDDDEFELYGNKLVEYEEITDEMERKIAHFLNMISEGSGEAQESDNIKILYRIIGELESLGDSGDNISRIMGREHLHNRKFNDEMILKINDMADKVDNAYLAMIENLIKASNNTLTSIENSYEIEKSINNTRNSLRDECIMQIQEHSENYQSLNYFLDIISELEAMGDFMINVSQSAIKKKH